MKAHNAYSIDIGRNIVLLNLLSSEYIRGILVKISINSRKFGFSNSNINRFIVTNLI